MLSQIFTNIRRLTIPRKHLIANITNKKQQLQAKIWLKLAREIKAAVKIGGPNPQSNTRLKAAIEKALQNNLSKEAINRNILGANKDQKNLVNLTYECYGPNGMQIIINVLTDNQNRVIANLHGYLTKLGGQIAKQNSVKRFFTELAIFHINKNSKTTYDFLLELLLPYEIVDLIEQGDIYEILAKPKDFLAIDHELKKVQCDIILSEIKLVANEKKEIHDHLLIEKIKRFFNQCEQDEDIQSVVTNINIK